jgi:ABC-2 type transport system permease protein
VLTWITHGDPLAYGVDGLRGVLIGTWHFSFATDMLLLSILAVAFLGTGAYLFSRIEL